MTRATITFALPPEALAFPVTQADLDALCVYDADHADGRPWRWPGVREARPGRFCVRRQDVVLAGRFATERAAACALVRYLKWRHGPATWATHAGTAAE